MLLYCQQLCKTFPPSAPAAWRAEADPEDLAATRCWEPPRETCPPRSFARVSCTPPLAQTTQAPDVTPLLMATTDAPCTPSRHEASAGPGAPLADPFHGQAHALVTAFSQRFHGRTQVTPAPKALAQAAQLLTQHGAATAQYLVDFSAHVAPETHDQPHRFGGIVHSLPRARAAYETRATQATAQQAEAATRRWQERSMPWRQEAVARLRAALPAEDLAALEAEHQARVRAAGTRAFALSLATRVAVDAALKVCAGLPSFADWRQMQEVC